MSQRLEQVRQSLLTRRRVLGAMAAAPVAAALIAKGIGVGATDPSPTPQLPPIKPPFDSVTGTVTGASGGTLTVQQADGTTATVTTSDATGAMLLKSITVGDLHTDDLISVSGDKTSDTAYAAKNIMHLGGMKGLPNGKVRIAIGTPGANGNVLYGTPPAGLPGTPVTGSKEIGYVQIASGTAGTALNGTPPPGDGKPQRFFISIGIGDGEGKPELIGQITAISGTTLTIKTPDDKNITVSTDANTTILTNQEGTVSDIAIGDKVTAVGEKSGTTLTAQSITFRHSG